MKRKNRPKHKLNKLATTVTIVSLVVLLLSFGYLSRQINLLIETTVLFSYVFFFNLFLFTKRDMNDGNILIWIFGSFYLVIKQCINFSHYSFLSGGLTPFWIIPLIIGLSAGILLVAFMWKNIKFWDKVLFFVILTAVITIFLSIMITNLNYALDYKEHTKTIITIEDKRVSGGYKKLTTYKFRFTQNDKKYYVEVPASDYAKYRVGDIYDIVVCEGAFGEEFYISGKYVE